MNLESGEYFAVTRGFKLNTTGFFGVFSFSNMFEGHKQQENDEVHYDRSYEGLVFFADEVCYPLVAARCVYSTHAYHEDYVGKTFSLNLTELEVMTLSKKYIESLKINSKAEAKP